jgi:glycosyltransferase involved in cell wall biosynthesis
MTNPEKQPLVSVCMLTHNSEKTIMEAIENLRNQTYMNWELIVIDDFSSDSTLSLIEAIEDRRINVTESETKNSLAQNRNLALEKSNGKYVAVLDSDDVWPEPTKLEKQVSFLESNPDHVLVGTWAKTINTEGEALKEIKHKEQDKKIRKQILIKNQFTHSSVVARKEALLLAGGYDTPKDTPIWEDYNMILKIGQQGKFANLPIYSTHYRVHPNNTSKNKLGARYHLNVIKGFKGIYPNYFIARMFGIVRLLLK